MSIRKLKQRIVICGSMSSYSLFSHIRNFLSDEGFSVIIPDSDEEILQKFPKINFDEHKRKASFNYLTKIKDPATRAILAVNPKKYEIDNYIGPNTFAEIAVAFAQKKKIYILYSYPAMYEDELLAWNAVFLNGNLDQLKIDLRGIAYNSQMQLPLFDCDD
jgi:diphthamide synthase subunit DPH2